VIADVFAGWKGRGEGGAAAVVSSFLGFPTSFSRFEAGSWGWRPSLGKARLERYGFWLFDFCDCGGEDDATSVDLDLRSFGQVCDLVNVGPMAGEFVDLEVVMDFLKERCGEEFDPPHFKFCCVVAAKKLQQVPLRMIS